MIDLILQSSTLTVDNSDLSTLSKYKLPLISSSKVIQKQKFTLASPGPVAKRQEKAHPHSVLTDPTGEYLVVPDLGADLIRIFQINSSNGMLTTCPSVRTSPGDGPRHGAWWVHGTGAGKLTVLYTINELSKSLTAWTVTYRGSECMSLERSRQYLRLHLARVNLAQQRKCMLQAISSMRPIAMIKPSGRVKIL